MGCSRRTTPRQGNVVAPEARMAPRTGDAAFFLLSGDGLLARPNPGLTADAVITGELEPRVPGRGPFVSGKATRRPLSPQ